MPKINPEWRITAFSRAAIPARKIEAFAVADILADVVAGRPSSWGGVMVRSAGGYNWSDWGRLNSDLTLQNVGFARFLPNGKVTYSPAIHTGTAASKKNIGGFFALPFVRALPVAGNVGPLAGQSPAATANNLKWNVLSGAFDHVFAPGTTWPSAILNSSAPSTPGIAQTASVWAKGAGLHCNILTIGTQEDSAGNAILQVSPSLRMVFQQNLPPLLQRRALVKNGNFTTEQWQTWKRLDDAGECKLRGENYDVSLFALNNRLVWQVNDSAVWLMEGEETGSTPAGAAPPDFARVRDMSALLGGAPLRLELNNLRAKLDVARRENKDNSGNLQTGTVTRTITRSGARGEMLSPFGVGNQPPGTSLPAQVSEDGQALTYTVTLTPDEVNSHTPFLTSFYLAYKPVWTTPVTSDSIDISAIVTRATLSHAHPPTQAGMDGSITVSLPLMNSLLPAAAPYVRDYNPVQLEARWDGGSWQGLGKGYFLGTTGEQSVYNDANLTLSIRGPMMRLQKLAAIVDGECVPAEYWFYRRIAAADRANAAAAENNFSVTRDGNGNPLFARVGSAYRYYGADAAQDIIEHFLGPQAAADFNGNGNARRFLPSGHPPFLSFEDMAGSWLAVSEALGNTLTAGSLKAQGGGLLMPPFGQDGLSWCNQFADDEFCIFTEGFPDRNARSFPSLMYGVRDEILSAAKLHAMSGSDADELLIKMASYETKPEKDVNRILVWSRPFGIEAPLAPALIQGEARLPPSHPRSAENTWPRTLVLENNLVQTPAQAQALAFIALMEAAGETFVFPRYTILGDADCMTGDVFTAQNAGLLGGENIRFRAERVEHEYTKDESGPQWTTNVLLRTMSDSEAYRFEREVL